MYLINKKEFEKKHRGTVYMKYCFTDGWVDEVMIKGDNIYSKNNEFIDWGESQLIDLGPDSFNNFERCEQSPEEHMYLQHDVYGRDGCFEEEQMFFILEPVDIEGIINRLQKSLERAYIS